MVFSLSFGGIQVRLSTSNDTDTNIKGVRNCNDGNIELDVSNFTGTIVLSAADAPSTEPSTSTDNEVLSRDMQVVQGVPEELNCSLSSVLQKFSPSNNNNTPTISIDNKDKISDGIQRQSSFLTANSHTSQIEPTAYIPQHNKLPELLSQQNSQLTVEIDSGDDDEEKKMQHVQDDELHSSGLVRFSNKPQVIPDLRPEADLTLHEMCASDDVEIDDLRDILRSKPELASVQDKFGDYAAHIFANNDSFIYTSSDYEVMEFVLELYKACPSAFLSEGYDGRLPFVGSLVDWVDDCHSMYERDNKQEVVRVSEIKSMTKSTRVINSLCVRDEVQRLLHLPEKVTLPSKVVYSFKMLSFILDSLAEQAFEDISTRREFWMLASKRRERIINAVASVPFIVRTILLIQNKKERDALIDSSIVKNLMFQPKSVDLWLVALLSGGERARSCATYYLCLISRSSLSGLVGRKYNWSESDRLRFHSMRADLYKEISKLTGFLPCMLHLKDDLYEVSTRRAVKYVVESTIGKPLPVYLQFMEMFLLLLLMTSYRIIVELVYAFPSEAFLSQYREFWYLSLSIASYFIMRDLIIMASFSSTEEKLVLRYLRGFGNTLGLVAMISALTVLSMLFVNGNVDGFNFTGIVMGMLWLKFLLQVKGMSESLSTLIYTIVQIGLQLRYFLTIFLIVIFFFGDMVDIVKKTSGDCEYFDGTDDSIESFCSLTPLQSYLAMYGVMIGGMEISTLGSSSPLVSLLFVAASFCGVIVLVNILIAIVTSEYEAARQVSCKFFARARLELAANHVARAKVSHPPDDPTSGWPRKLWRLSSSVKYFGVIYMVEYFLVMSLISCTSLYREGILGNFLYVSLILVAILYHLFLVAMNMYLVARSICNMECLRFLRGTKFHRGMLKICLIPVCRYLSAVGLGQGEKCPGKSALVLFYLMNSYVNMKDLRSEGFIWPLYASDIVEEKDHAVYNGQLQSNISEEIRASEARILHAIRSMTMFQSQPKEFE